MGAEVWLQRGFVTNVGKIAVKGLKITADVGAAPGDGALFRVHDPAEGTQKARLTGAIATGDLQAFSCVDREPHPLEDVTVAPPQVQILGLQSALRHGVGERGWTMARESRKFSGLAP